MLKQANLELQNISSVYGENIAAFIVPYEIVSNDKGYYFFKVDTSKKEGIKVAIRETLFNENLKAGNIKLKSLKINANITIDTQNKLLLLKGELFYIHPDSLVNKGIDSHYYEATSLKTLYSSLVVFDLKQLQDFRINASYILLRNGFLPNFLYIQNAQNPYKTFSITNSQKLNASPIVKYNGLLGELKQELIKINFVNYEYSKALKQYYDFLNDTLITKDFGIMEFSSLRNAGDMLSHSSLQSVIFEAEIKLDYCLFASKENPSELIKTIQAVLIDTHLFQQKD